MRIGAPVLRFPLAPPGPLPRALGRDLARFEDVAQRRFSHHCDAHAPLETHEIVPHA